MEVIDDKDIRRLHDYSHLVALRDRLWRRRDGEHKGGAALLVGAGMSMNADPQPATFPTWPQLSKKLWKELGGDARAYGAGTSDMIRLADEYQAFHGQSRLYEFISNNIPDRFHVPADVHRRLLELPWSDVFTTNWDTLLERAAGMQERRRYSVVTRSEQLTWLTRPRIIKLHGSLPDIYPIVFTEEDYRRYPDTHAEFINVVRSSLIENIFCCIGFSGDDPNFLQFHGWVRDRLGSSALRVYLVTLDPVPKASRARLFRYGVVPIDLSGLIDSDSACLSPTARRDAIGLFISELNNQQRSVRIAWPDIYVISGCSGGAPSYTSSRRDRRGKWPRMDIEWPRVAEINLRRPMTPVDDQEIYIIDDACIDGLASKKLADILCQLRDDHLGWVVLPFANRDETERRGFAAQLEEYLRGIVSFILDSKTACNSLIVSLGLVMEFMDWICVVPDRSIAIRACDALVKIEAQVRKLRGDQKYSGHISKKALCQIIRSSRRAALSVAAALEKGLASKTAAALECLETGVSNDDGIRILLAQIFPILVQGDMAAANRCLAQLRDKLSVRLRIFDYRDYSKPFDFTWYLLIGAIEAELGMFHEALGSYDLALQHTRRITASGDPDQDVRVRSMEAWTRLARSQLAIFISERQTSDISDSDSKLSDDDTSSSDSTGAGNPLGDGSFEPTVKRAAEIVDDYPFDLLFFAEAAEYRCNAATDYTQSLLAAEGDAARDDVAERDKKFWKAAFCRLVETTGLPPVGETRRLLGKSAVSLATLHPEYAFGVGARFLDDVVQAAALAAGIRRGLADDKDRSRLTAIAGIAKTAVMNLISALKGPSLSPELRRYSEWRLPIALRLVRALSLSDEPGALVSWKNAEIGDAAIRDWTLEQLETLISGVKLQTLLRVPDYVRDLTRLIGDVAAGRPDLWPARKEDKNKGDRGWIGAFAALAELPLPVIPASERPERWQVALRQWDDPFLRLKPSADIGAFQQSLESARHHCQWVVGSSPAGPLAKRIVAIAQRRVERIDNYWPAPSHPPTAGI